MDNAERPEQVSQKDLQKLVHDVRWLTVHTREMANGPSKDLVARCTIFSATLTVLLACSLPWGRVAEDGSYSPADALRLTGWQLVDYWVDDVEFGPGVFAARFLVITVVVTAIPGLCVLVPMPRLVGLVASVLLWLLTIGIGLVIMVDTERFEFAFELNAWVAVVIMGALASSWTWWTSSTDAGWSWPGRD